MLHGVSVSENQRQMCLMLTNNLTNNSMNTKLKCTFGYKINASISEEYNRNIIIKQEESAMVFE